MRNIWFGLMRVSQSQGVTGARLQVQKLMSFFVAITRVRFQNLGLAQLIPRNPCRRSGSNERQTTGRLLGPSKEPHTHTICMQR